MELVHLCWEIFLRSCRDWSWDCLGSYDTSFDDWRVCMALEPRISICVLDSSSCTKGFLKEIGTYELLSVSEAGRDLYQELRISHWRPAVRLCKPIS